MTTVTALLNFARGELGYREGARNDTKYSRAYGMNYVPWCAEFLWWCAREASGGDLLVPKMAYTPAMASWFTQQGDARYGTVPKRGAVAFFDFPDSVRRIQHAGLVERVLADGRIVTLEGNTSSGEAGSQANGDGVYRRVRDPRHVVVYGYPAYTPEKPARPAPAPSRDTGRTLPPLIVDGVWGPRTTRRLELYLHHSPADGRVDPALRRRVQRWLGVREDGVWGRVTRRALQRKVGATVDGVVGPQTTRCLQRFLNRHL